MRSLENAMTRTIGLVVCLAPLTGLVSAHHGFGSFDMTRAFFITP